MKKIIFIGNIGCGKTTLSQAILGEKLEYQKTQAVEVRGSNILDTPGEYLELNHYRGALMITSADAEVIAFVQSAVDSQRMFPPGYGGSYAKDVIGIVTKIDLATEEEICEAEKFLKTAGVNRIFKVSSYQNLGIDEIKDYLKE
ncbi:MAG: EutP/PduV family microcompartment system protein [Hornefia sp.]|nr:EutP/PduV family microcompartment system protein [Hornefia sp.]